MPDRAAKMAGMTRLLLVEDNDMNRDMLTRRLQRRGFEIVVAGDGEEGIAQAKAVRPDLILLDMSLPVVDGWETVRRIKKDASTRRIPVLGLSSHAMPGDRDRAVEAGCDDYDTKPIDLDRLLAKIATLLESRGDS